MGLKQIRGIISQSRSLLNRVPPNQRDATWEKLNLQTTILEKLDDTPILEKTVQASNLLYEAKEQVKDIVPSTDFIKNETLEIIEGLGGAFVRGIDSAADAVRDKLRGKEPEVIAGITSSVVVVLVGIALFNMAKTTKYQ